jgi:hypothetical protein
MIFQRAYMAFLTTNYNYQVISPKYTFANFQRSDMCVVADYNGHPGQLAALPNNVNVRLTPPS